MVDFTREVREALEAAGCSFLRHGKGDHDIWQSPVTGRFVVDGKIRSRHSANKTLESAGLPKTF